MPNPYLQPVLFIDTPTSQVNLSDIQRVVARRRQQALEYILDQGPLARLEIQYPPPRSYKIFLLRLIGYLKAQGIQSHYFNTSIHTFSDLTDVPGSPLAIVFSDTTPQLPEILAIAEQLKSCWPDTWVIVGGPHSTCYPQDLINNAGIDVVVCGEGDIAFREIISARVRQTPLEALDVQGAVTRYSRFALSRTQLAPPVVSMDSLPFPDYNSLPGGLAAFHAYLVSARGCPFSCPYCVQGRNGNYRRFSVRRTWQEIGVIWEHIKHTYNIIHIADDNITSCLDDRIQEFLKQRWHEVESYFCGEIRLEECTKSNLLALKELGFVQLNIGLESMDERVQRYVAKQISFEAVQETLGLIKDIFQGEVLTKAYFMVGLPGETIDTFKVTSERTIELMKKNLLDLASVRMYKPLPGTTIFEKPDRFGITLDYSDYAQFERYSFPPVHHLNGLSAMDIYLLYLMFEDQVATFNAKKYNLELFKGETLQSMSYASWMSKLV